MKKNKDALIAVVSILAIIVHLLLRFAVRSSPFSSELPLLLVLVVGTPLLCFDLVIKVWRRELGADLLAVVAVVGSIFLKEYLAGTIIVLMFTGGAVLEAYAVDTASSVLKALARRTPQKAHRKKGSEVVDIQIDTIDEGEVLVVFPHEIAPVDGVVIEGRGSMDESFLTGEPFQMSKAPGSYVLSGAVNGETVLTLQATKRAVDSRYAKIMEVVKAAEKNPPSIRRLGDQIGAVYAPLALFVAVLTWVLTGESSRFLAVLVIATPCPLILAIPIAVIGSISLCARRGIIVRKPIALEQVNSCRTIIFDKTGTLTYGQPKLMEQIYAPDFTQQDVLSLVASLERYSRHPLANAILSALKQEKRELLEATEVSEKPGGGLSGIVNGHKIQVIGRKSLMKVLSEKPPVLDTIPPGQLECFILVDGVYAATYRFRDEPRAEGYSFIAHLGPKHQFQRKIILSGDRESEVRYLAEKVGINEVYGGKTPEEKLKIVREQVKISKTVYVGDGINDAPALLTSTVGIAVGQNSDITAEAAGAVVLDNSLSKIDEFLHISRRMKMIALESAVIGMSLSMMGMALASLGYLTPVQGAIAQEIIDLIAIANALRASFLPRVLIDF